MFVLFLLLQLKLQIYAHARAAIKVPIPASALGTAGIGLAAEQRLAVETHSVAARQLWQVKVVFETEWALPVALIIIGAVAVPSWARSGSRNPSTWVRRAGVSPQAAG